VITPEPSELQELVQDLHRQATPWLPAGHVTRLHWGPPVQGLVLSTTRLNRIVEHCVGDFTVTVQAGVPLRQLQQELAAQGQWLALDWPWGSGADGAGSGTVGGLVARGMAGGLRQRYLGVRDQLIGLALLRADGTAAKAGGKVVKNVAGYDLMRLFTGSWGSLGLITELTLRTFPRPVLRQGLLLQGPLPALDQLRRHCLSSALMPELIDWWSPALARASGAASEASLLISLASVSPEAIADQLRAWSALAAATGLNPQTLDAERLEALGAISLGPDQGEPMGQRGRWLLRLGVLPARAGALLVDPLVAGLPLNLAAGSGVGLAWAEADQLPGYRVEALRRRCLELGGYLMVLEQPTGSALPAWENAPARPVIEALKREFDPLQQLARGRLPGVRPPAPQA
jgi:glycolate oxidase FAD binding subunit